MSSKGVLASWYRKHLGEPFEADHVYGYWAFLLGALLGLIGLIVYLYSATLDPALTIGDQAWALRAVAASAAMVGGGLVAYSVVFLLPLQPKAARISGVGFLLTLIATGLFNWAYPSNWYWAGASPDYSPLVMSLYALGILIMIGTIFLFPLFTAETRDVDDVAGNPGTATTQESKATFELYEDAADEWRWRLVHDNGNIIADSGEGYASKQKARQGMESVKRNSPGAPEEVIERDSEVVEADEADEQTAVASTAEESEFEFDADTKSQARFEVYKDAADEWRWRLRHRNGNIIADSGEGYSTRNGLDEAVDRIASVAPKADTLDYEPAAYEVYKDAADEWRWRLRHKNGRILADGGEGYASRSNARDGIQRVRKYVTDDENVEVYQDAADEWRWRLTAPNGEIIADSGQGYSRESSARDAVERIQEHAPEADTLDYEPAAYELYKDAADEWRWRLRHRNGEILADSGEGYTSKQKAKQGMQSVMRNAGEATTADLEADEE